MQRFARSRIDADLFRFQPFHLRQRLHQIVGEPVGITTALRNDGGGRLACRSTGAERVFVRVNPNRIFRKVVHESVSKHRFGHNAQRQRGGCGRRQTEKRTTGREWATEVVIVGHHSPRGRNLTAKSARFPSWNFVPWVVKVSQTAPLVGEPRRNSCVSVLTFLPSTDRQKK